MESDYVFNEIQTVSSAGDILRMPRLQSAEIGGRYVFTDKETLTGYVVLDLIRGEIDGVYVELPITRETVSCAVTKLSDRLFEVEFDGYVYVLDVLDKTLGLVAGPTQPRKVVPVENRRITKSTKKAINGLVKNIIESMARNNMRYVADRTRYGVNNDKIVLEIESRTAGAWLIPPKGSYIYTGTLSTPWGKICISVESGKDTQLHWIESSITKDKFKNKADKLRDILAEAIIKEKARC